MEKSADLVAQEQMGVLDMIVPELNTLVFTPCKVQEKEENSK